MKEAAMVIDPVERTSKVVSGLIGVECSVLFRGLRLVLKTDESEAKPPASGIPAE